MTDKEWKESLADLARLALGANLLVVMAKLRGGAAALGEAADHTSEAVQQQESLAALHMHGHSARALSHAERKMLLHRINTICSEHVVEPGGLQFQGLQVWMCVTRAASVCVYVCVGESLSQTYLKQAH
eukprot:1137517-Pelagomonas_calceolata.AAC.1